jgi:hypothetical protein
MAESIETLVTKLRSMTVVALRQRYGELFGEPTNSFSKPRLIKRIVWRTQALREGDLPERARKRAGELANDADLRLRAPLNPPGNPEPEVVVSPFRVLDPRRPMPGAVLRREYKGRLIEVRVLPNGFGDMTVRRDALTIRSLGCHRPCRSSDAGHELSATTDCHPSSRTAAALRRGPGRVAVMS